MAKIDLENVRIAAPCPASWAEMEGDDRSRFCKDCKLNVYNVEAMSKDEAEALIEEREGRVCMRLYRRPDGKILTADCPTGVRRRRKRRIGIAATIALLFGGGATATAAQSASTRTSITRSSVFSKPMDFVAHRFNITRLCNCPPMMGVVCVTPPPPPPVVPTPPPADPSTAPEGEAP
jgi:hypothetical protein